MDSSVITVGRMQPQPITSSQLKLEEIQSHLITWWHVALLAIARRVHAIRAVF
jgi:hypothetical protein